MGLEVVKHKHMSGVYKISMVRMYPKDTDESSNVQLYTQTTQKCVGIPLRIVSEV
ncbi:TPA: hypothetical protein STZ38_000459 [Clostridioides difficile]|nr:hypothetical protein [Clostridioides difficile]